MATRPRSAVRAGDGYGADHRQRQQLSPLIERCTHMYDLLVDGARTGRESWARLHAEDTHALGRRSHLYGSARSAVRQALTG